MREIGGVADRADSRTRRLLSWRCPLRPCVCLWHSLLGCLCTTRSPRPPAPVTQHQHHLHRLCVALTNAVQPSLPLAVVSRPALVSAAMDCSSPLKHAARKAVSPCVPLTSSSVWAYASAVCTAAVAGGNRGNQVHLAEVVLGRDVAPRLGRCCDGLRVALEARAKEGGVSFFVPRVQLRVTNASTS